jgi:hypothetical protein
MDRCIKPEILDELPPDDPRAVRSRKDLTRINAWMGNGGIMARALRATAESSRGPRMVELGGGDGRFLLRVARRLAGEWQDTSAVLLDRRAIVSPEIRHGFKRLGWRLETVEVDVFHWLNQEVAVPCDVMVANLFLHHFPEAQLALLFRAAARRARVFIALEPRRSAWSLACSRMLWTLSCNAVTRHDAPVSVRAGFAGKELSRLWPAATGWSLTERRAGWFSHLFTAQRSE